MCKFGVFVSFLRLCLLNWDGQHKECDWRINKDIWDNRREPNWRIQMTVRFDMDCYYHLCNQLERIDVTIQVM